MSPHDAVVIAGPTLSALLCSANMAIDGDGLVIGSIVQHGVTEATDRHEARTWQRSDICIQSFWRNDDFYTADGSLSPDFIDSVKAKLSDDGDGGRVVIGWYRARKNTPTRPSLREIQVHNSLLGAAESHKELFCVPSHFVFMLVCGESEVDGSVKTQNYRAMLIQSHHKHIESIPVRIPNLLHGTVKEHSSFTAGVSGVDILLDSHTDVQKQKGKGKALASQEVDFGSVAAYDGDGSVDSPGPVHAMEQLLEKSLQAIEAEAKRY